MFHPGPMPYAPPAPAYAFSTVPFRRGPPPPGTVTGTCDDCGLPGHFAKDCAAYNKDRLDRHGQPVVPGSRKYESTTRKRTRLMAQLAALGPVPAMQGAPAPSG